MAVVLPNISVIKNKNVTQFSVPMIYPFIGALVAQNYFIQTVSFPKIEKFKFSFNYFNNLFDTNAGAIYLTNNHKYSPSARTCIQAFFTSFNPMPYQVANNIGYLRTNSLYSFPLVGSGPGLTSSRELDCPVFTKIEYENDDVLRFDQKTYYFSVFIELDWTLNSLPFILLDLQATDAAIAVITQIYASFSTFYELTF